MHSRFRLVHGGGVGGGALPQHISTHLTIKGRVSIVRSRHPSLAREARVRRAVVDRVVATRHTPVLMLVMEMLTVLLMVMLVLLIR